MKNIFTFILLSAFAIAPAQVIIGNAAGTAAIKTSVLLEFAAGLNKGIIVPYVRTLPAATALTQGTILLDASTPTAARMRFSNGTSWVDLSGQGADVTTALATQPIASVAPEVADSKSIIGARTSTADGVLVLESTTKAMVLPIVADVQNIPDPSPGMMVYVNKAGAKRLAVYNGSRWSFWSDNNIVPTVTSLTGRVWMDRNLGASQVATSITDAASYGDLYQWGRLTDGHEKRNSPNSAQNATSSTDVPGNSNFIINNSGDTDWRSPANNNLWQGVNGINNPCPGGFRLPTSAEMTAERNTWSSPDAAGAFASPLKLPLAGIRYPQNGSYAEIGVTGYYWTSTINNPYANFIQLNANYGIITGFRGDGISVRCIKD